MAQEDFTKGDMDSLFAFACDNKSQETQSWNETQLRQLTESVLRHEENWEAVAADLGESAEDCILRFLEMPMTEAIFAKKHTPAQKSGAGELTVLMDTSNP